MRDPISRRNAIAKIAGSVAWSATLAPFFAAKAGEIATSIPALQPKPALEEICHAALRLGLPSVDLQGPDAWPALEKFGLTCAVANGADLGLRQGFARLENHARLSASYQQIIPQAARAGVSGLICYAGTGAKPETETALANFTSGLQKILRLAEKNKVTLLLDLTNNGVSSKDYDPDASLRYAQFSRRLGSEQFKILQEVYQVQAMPRAALADLSKFHPYLGFYYPQGLPKKPEFAQVTATSSEKLVKYNRALKLPA